MSKSKNLWGSLALTAALAGCTAGNEAAQSLCKGAACVPDAGAGGEEADGGPGGQAIGNGGGPSSGGEGGSPAAGAGGGPIGGEPVGGSAGPGGAGGEPVGGDPSGGQGGGPSGGQGGDPSGGQGGQGGGDPGGQGGATNDGGASGGGGVGGTPEPGGGLAGAGGEPLGGAGGEPVGGVQPPPNEPPVAAIDAPDVVAPGALVVLDGARSWDPEGGMLTYMFTQLAGPPVDLMDAAAARAGFIAPQGRDALVFELQVTDPQGAIGTAEATIQLANHPPRADAGPDQLVDPSQVVTLDATASEDPDGDPIIFAWRQIAGPAVALDDPFSARPAFTSPDARASVTFELTVSDGLAEGTDTVGVHVFNRPPVVDAGPDRAVARRAAVVLNGSAVDPDGDVLTLRWRQVGGPPVRLDDPTRPDPSFLTPDARAALTFELIANDGAVDSAPDTVTLLVENIPPTANAGGDQLGVEPGSLVQLDGSGEDLDGDPLTFRWIQVEGPAVLLSDVRAPQPTFVAPAVRSELLFELTADDGYVSSRPDAVRVTVRNTPPVADAGPDARVEQGARVQLDGGASRDADGDPLTFRWVQTGGHAVALDGANGVRPHFDVPPGRDVLTFQLVVNDGFADSAPDEVRVEVLNGAPVADGGPDQSVEGDTDVALDGRGSSDPDGDALNYVWSQTEGAVQLIDRFTARPRFRAPLPRQRLRFQLVVDDGQLSSAPDEVVVDVRNHPPVANAGRNQEPDRNAEGTLDGRESRDLDGDPLSYRWRQIRGEDVALANPNSARPSFRAPNRDVTLEFELIVNDGFVDSLPDTVSIFVGGN